MADTPTKIDDLPAAGIANLTDLFEVSQAGTSRKLQTSQLLGLVPPPPNLAPYATLASPTFTGDPKAPTPPTNDNDTSIATTAHVKAAIAAALAAAGLIFRNYITGFVHSSAGATQNLTVGGGQAADSLNAVWINLAAPITKSLAAPWAAGSGNGGLGAGVALAINTWYFPFAILNGGLPDIYFDTDATGANAPAGTTAKRRLRPIWTDGTGNIIPHTGKADLVLWTTVVGEGNPVVGNIVTLKAVPPGIQTFWQGRFWGQGTAGTGWGYDIFHAGGVGNSAFSFVTVGVGGQSASGALSLLTNTAQQVQAAQVGTNAPQYATWGFIDDCGRGD
jgi:hypothetical protein